MAETTGLSPVKYEFESHVPHKRSGSKMVKRLIQDQESVSSILTQSTTDGRKVGVLIGFENRDVGKLAWEFDPLFIRNGIDSLEKPGL